MQYKSPLYKYLGSLPGLDLTVYYYSPAGLSERPDSRLGKMVRWDVPLLEGYKYEFVRNWLPEAQWNPSFLGAYLNPGIVWRLFSNRYDAVIVHSYQFPSDWLAWAETRRSKTGLLFYGEVSPVSRPTYSRRMLRSIVHKTMIQKADACLAVSSFAAQAFLEEFDIPGEKIFSAPYAVDNDFFIKEVDGWKPQRAQLKAQAGIPADQPVVLFVSRLAEGKGHLDLVEGLKRARVQAKLILVGYGLLEDEIRKFCQEQLPGVLLTGFINQSELPRYYAMADLFVHPSHHEEFSLVLNEAMCAGLPILASSGVANAHEMVTPGENGEFFPSGDCDALADRLREMLSDPHRLVRYGRRSREIVSDWGIDRSAAGIIAAVEYVVSQKRRH